MYSQQMKFGTAFGVTNNELNDKKIGVLASIATLLIVFLLLYISTIENAEKNMWNIEMTLKKLQLKKLFGMQIFSFWQKFILC